MLRRISLIVSHGENKSTSDVTEMREHLNRVGSWSHCLLGFRPLAHTHRYQEAVKLTGLDYGTLKNDALVAAAIEKSRRRDFLSFSHHTEVAYW